MTSDALTRCQQSHIGDIGHYCLIEYNQYNDISPDLERLHNNISPIKYNNIEIWIFKLIENVI